MTPFLSGTDLKLAAAVGKPRLHWAADGTLFYPFASKLVRDLWVGEDTLNRRATKTDVDATPIMMVRRQLERGQLPEHLK